MLEVGFSESCKQLAREARQWIDGTSYEGLKKMNSIWAILIKSKKLENGNTESKYKDEEIYLPLAGKSHNTKLNTSGTRR